MRYYLSLLLTIIFLISTTELVDADSSSPPYRIGALLDLSGEYASQGRAFREGVELAATEVNKNGGIDGKPLEIIYEDTQYNMTTLNSAAKKLINLDKVLGSLVMTSTEAMSVGPQFERAKVPLINMWDSAPELDALGQYVFGIGAWTPSTTDKASQFAIKNLNAHTAVVIHSVGQWSETAGQDFARKFAEGGGKVLEVFAVQPNDNDFRAVLTRMRSLSPQVVYAPVSDNIPAFFKQYRSLDLHIPLITSDVLSDELIKASEGATEGVYQTLSGDPQGPETQKMLELYKHYFKRECDQILFTTWGYDAVRLFAQALHSGAQTPEQIKQYLYTVKDFSGASSMITIDPNGSSRVLVEIFQIKDTQLTKIQ